ncbi:MAG: hypothetical protein ACRD9Y_08395 [Blastocatellia bacterium]
MPLKKVTIYFTEEEYAELQAIADDEEVTLSAVLRAKLGLTYKRRGAPTGNTNRRVRAKANPQDRTGNNRH